MDMWCEKCKKETRHYEDQYLVPQYDLGYEVLIPQMVVCCSECGRSSVKKAKSLCAKYRPSASPG